MSVFIFYTFKSQLYFILREICVFLSSACILFILVLCDTHYNCFLQFFVCLLTLFIELGPVGAFFFFDVIKYIVNVKPG